MNRSSDLSVIAVSIRNKPGWLAGMMEAFDLTIKERLELELLDERLMLAEREVAAWDKETRFERSVGIYGLEPDEAISVLSKNISEAHEEYLRQSKAGYPYADRLTMLVVRQIERQEKFRRNLRSKQLHTRGEVRNDGSVTDFEIETAKGYPLEKLVPELDRNGYMRCQWHNGESKKFFVKNGWGYCFVCNVSVDSIKWMMDVEKMNFIEAVRRLNGRL